MSQAWGTLSRYRKFSVSKEDAREYDWEHLSEINFTEKYKYYAHTYDNGTFSMIEANNAYTHGGLARIKHFLTEYSRGYVFNMLSTHKLAKDVVRIHTDGICFKKPIDFPALKLDYYPVPEDKSTGTIKFYNLNCYYHICGECEVEYQFIKKMPHRCHYLPCTRCETYYCSDEDHECPEDC
jgi:hypothetical protein